MATPRTDPAEKAHAAAASSTAAGGHLRRRGLGIQSKLLIMLLLVSMLATLTIGVLAYFSGRNAMRHSVFDRLTALRESRKGQIERYFDALAGDLVVMGHDLSMIDAMRTVSQDFATLESATLTPEQLAQIDAFYQGPFAKQLDANSAGTPAVGNYQPVGNAQRYVQFHYTIASTDPSVTSAVNDAGDGSAWSAAHSRFHPFLRDLSSRFEFEDLMLIDLDGNIVYTVAKGIELGTNLQRGFYSDTLLGEAFVKMRASGNVDYVDFIDYQEYLPSFGAPTAFILTPIHEGETILGVAAVKLPAEAVNRIMTDAGNWKTDGLGDTGETYLAGADFLMRSQSRFLIEDPDAFAQQVRSAGTPQETIDRMLQLGTTILLQPVRSPSVEAAVSGQTGTYITEDYRNISVLSSYSPVRVDDLDWVIVSKIDAAEAFSSEQSFARLLLLSTAGIIVVVSTASLALAQVFARPIRRLSAAARRVSAGDTSATIPTPGGDELGDLTVALDDLRTTLRRRDEQLADDDEQIRRLVLNIMPEQLAGRYLNGEAGLAQQHQNVAVIAASLGGWNALVADVDAVHASELLNELIRAADEAAVRNGVDKTRVSDAGYLATCGVIVPRVDFARRAVAFARELQEIVARFNVRNKSNLLLRVGIDAGSVTSALVGGDRVSYDIWGEPVEMAHRLTTQLHVEGIVVSDRVYRRLRDSDTFEAAGTMDTSGGAQPVWTLVDEHKSVTPDVPSGRLQG